MASIVTELFERFDVDGVEMDFNRHPAFFRPNEAAAHSYLVTDLVRHVRRRMDEVGAARGKRILLAVRVPPTLADSRRVGLDVRQWIAEGLVDIVTAGIGFVLFGLPIREFVEAARGRASRSYGCIEALRPAVDQRVMRRWRSGAGTPGPTAYTSTTSSPCPATGGDPSSTRSQTQTGWSAWTPGTSSTAGNGPASSAPTPVWWAPTSQPSRAPCPGSSYPSPCTTPSPARARPPVRHRPQVEAARADGSLRGCALGLRLQGLTQDDTLSVTLNGHHLPWETANVSFDGWTQMHLDGDAFETYPSRVVERVHDGVEAVFPISCPPLKYGKNELEVRLLRADNPSAQEVVLKGVHITIAYEPS